MTAPLAVRLDRIVVPYLVDKGALPPWAVTAKQTETLEVKLSRRLTRAFAGVEDDIVRELKLRGLSAPVIDQAVASSMGERFATMRESVARAGVESGMRGRRRVAGEWRAQGGQVRFQIPDKLVRENIRTRELEFADDAFGRIESDIRGALEAGYNEGLGIDDIARQKLGPVVDTAKGARLRMIARSEVQGAQNDTAHGTMVEIGVAYEQWLTARDGRVRGLNPDDEADHVSLQGQVVGVDEVFSNGLRYPGDRSGSLVEWINCRCRSRPYLPPKGREIAFTPHYP